jgi:hypothetical protein
VKTPSVKTQSMLSAVVAFSTFAFSSVAFGQTSLATTNYVPQRTPEGFPDLEGLWQPQQNGAKVSSLPHEKGFLLGTGSKTGVVEGRVLPYQPWAAKLVDYRLEHMGMDPTGHCHYEGVPHAMYFPFQIFETGDEIAMVFENMHAYRIVHMKGQHPKDYLAWMGDSRGHWEGNSLVVDVADSNDKGVFDMAGHFHSDALHVTERFTPIDRDNIAYDATIEDPKVFTRPFKMHFSFKRAPKEFQIMEAGCFEGERDQTHFVDGIAKIPNHYDNSLNSEGPKNSVPSASPKSGSAKSN